MNKEILKDIISIKLRLADGVIDRLPFHAKEVVRKGEKSFLAAIHEATEDCAVKDAADNQKKDIKPIAIE